MAPVVERIARELDVIISVHTSTPAVMRETARLGAGLINDVRSLQRDGALDAAAATGLPVCLMHMLGEPGGGFAVAQARLGGGRVHHAMRTVGQCRRALEMMCERALSRRSQGTLLADKGAVQQMIADSQIELEQFRLLVINTAWIIDQNHDNPRTARAHISMVKVAMAKIYHDIVQRSLHVHGSLGTTLETPLAAMWMNVPAIALADGPTEVHRATVAKSLLRQFKPAPGLFPTEHIPPKVAKAKARYQDILETHLPSFLTESQA